jgi:Na+-transporting NADH:ubiquinone oxidoreductase subunit C
MKKNSFTMLYAIMLGLVCSVIPTAVVTYTAPLREANAKAEEIRNIFTVLEIPYERRATSGELVRLFDRDVKTDTIGDLIVYERPGAGLVAVPFAGRGIWGPIKGLLSLQTDYATIHGISFYYQEETPGLGGEISSPGFRDKFKGKSIVDASGKPGFRILRTGASGLNEIDGISGATLTCNKVDLLLNGMIRHLYRERSNVK